MEKQSLKPAQESGNLTKTQEIIIIALSKNLLLPLNDLLVVVQAFLKPGITLSTLANCLKEQKTTADKGHLAEDDQHQYKAFKSYDLGFVHINVGKLPIIKAGEPQAYLFIAVDRATHWVYSEVLDENDTLSAIEFLYRLGKAVPFKITRVLTEKNSTFAFLSDEPESVGKHQFEQACNRLDIQHLITRQSGVDSYDLIDQNELLSSLEENGYFKPGQTLRETIEQYQAIYNEQIPQINLGHISPAQALERWLKMESETLRTKKAFKISGTQLLIIWIVWIAITLFFASQAIPGQ
jgi:hypothetical protein